MVKQNQKSRGIFYSIWNFFTSITLTIVVLLSLALASIVGTVVPQNESPAQYIHEYGEKFYNVFNSLDLFDMYHSWWYQGLIVIMCINLVVCSINRLSASWSIIFPKIPVFNITKYRKLQTSENSLVSRHTPEKILELISPVISSNFRYSRIDNKEGSTFIFAEKGRWTRLGVYVVHLSVILLLVGGLIGSISGFEGYVNIYEGETTNIVRNRETGGTKKLDFSVRCDEFSVSYYSNGTTPKEYRSKLTILENGKTVMDKSIIVNDPLRYRGMNFFQSSYGTGMPKDIEIDVRSVKTGKVYSKKLKLGEGYEIPDGNGKLIVSDFREEYNYRGSNIGETFICRMIPATGKPFYIILPINYPSFDSMRKGETSVSVTHYCPSYYTGLQVTSDPGVDVVYAGFIIMIIGFYITFFMSHKTLAVEIASKNGKNRIMISGAANKNPIGMENKLKALTKKVSGIING